MKNKLKIVAVGFILALIFTSCQQIFTISAFSFVETDISTMTEEQQVSYAEDLLLSGTATTEELQAAYDAVFEQLPDDWGDADPEALVLAADLAIGASGVGGAVTDALEVFTSDGEPSAEDIEAIYSSIDTDNLSAAVDLIVAAEAIEGVTLSSEQYTNAAAAQVLVVLADVEALGVADPSALDDSIPAQAAIIADLEQALTWADAGGVDLSMFGEGISLP